MSGSERVVAVEENTGIDEVEAEEEEEEEEETIDQELRSLYDDTETMIARYTKQEQRVRDKKELFDAADIYRLISSDLLPLIRDVIAASGAAITNVAQMAIDLSSDEEGTSEEEEEQIDEETLQVYSTLLANHGAFSQLLETPGMDPQAKAGIASLLELNSSSLKIFDDQFGDGIKQALAAKMKEHEQNAVQRSN